MDTIKKHANDIAFLVTFFCAITAALVLGWIVGNTDLSREEQSRFNTWASRCYTDGGMVALTAVHGNNHQYECFKNGKIINHVN